MVVTEVPVEFCDREEDAGHQTEEALGHEYEEHVEVERLPTVVSARQRRRQRRG